MDGLNTIAMTEARENLSELVNQVAFGKTRVSLMRKNKPVACLVPIEDIELLEAIEDRMDILSLDSVIDEMNEQGTVSLAELKKL